MGRRVQPRVTYQADLRFLMRLIEAIMQDKYRSLKWKRLAIRRARALTALLLKEPPSFGSRKADEVLFSQTPSAYKSRGQG